MVKTIQASKLRNSFKSALGHLKKSKEPLAITERGIPTSVLVSIDEYEDFLVAKDPQFIASIKTARQGYKNKKAFLFTDVFGNLS